MGTLPNISLPTALKVCLGYLKTESVCISYLCVYQFLQNIPLSVSFMHILHGAAACQVFLKVTLRRTRTSAAVCVCMFALWLILNGLPDPSAFSHNLRRGNNNNLIETSTSSFTRQNDSIH